MNPLHGRTTSGFPLSIATGMAMETLFAPQQAVYDPGRVAPSRILLSAYQELWINGLTLIRNAYQACEAGMIKDITPMHMVEVIMQEIELIRDLLTNEGKNFTIPRFYFNNYDNLFSRSHPIFKRRVDKTPLQQQVRFIYEKTKDMLIRQDPEILRLNLEIKPSGPSKALILTHLPVDLLSYRYFEDLKLLESHTGKVKSRVEWNSKYHGCGEADMGRLPFCRQLLSIFGDQSLIVPLPLKARREILDLGKKQRWTPVTSAQKVQGDMAYFLKDLALASAIKTIPIF